MTVTLTDNEVESIFDCISRIDTFLLMLAKIEARENGNIRCPLSNKATSQLNSIADMIYQKAMVKGAM